MFLSKTPSPLTSFLPITSPPPIHQNSNPKILQPNPKSLLSNFLLHASNPATSDTQIPSLRIVLTSSSKSPWQLSAVWQPTGGVMQFCKKAQTGKPCEYIAELPERLVQDRRWIDWCRKSGVRGTDQMDRIIDCVRKGGKVDGSNVAMFIEDIEKICKDGIKDGEIKGEKGEDSEKFMVRENEKNIKDEEGVISINGKYPLKLQSKITKYNNKIVPSNNLNKFKLSQKQNNKLTSDEDEYKNSPNKITNNIKITTNPRKEYSTSANKKNEKHSLLNKYDCSYNIMQANPKKIKYSFI